MRITYLVAGAGDMYCGACARDVNLIHELTARGHDVSVTALYTPLHADEESVLGTAPVFYGGINVYLQQTSSFFRATPSSVDRILDNPALLNWVSKFAIKTRAEDLGPMTVSVLEGKDGKQKKELDRLIQYLKENPAQDVINITNSLLSGIAPELKSQLKAPVVCTLQGEDGFINIMPEPYKSKAKELMRKNAEFIDLFISPGESYAERMSEFLDIKRDKIKVIHAGINQEIYRNSEPRKTIPFIIGYLSVVTTAKGLDILADAFIKLVNTRQHDAYLHVVGKILDEEYFEAISKRLDSENLSSRFKSYRQVDLTGKLDFLKNCSVFVAPGRIEESRGMVVMEAMSMGIPVVTHDRGVFPEMMALTQGGLVVPAENSDAFVDVIEELIENPDRADLLGQQGTAGIAKHYSSQQMAEQTLAAYSELLK
ncbi:MAG: glycosyltransferase family 4 protein [Armatimonadota bacterium]